MADKQVKIVGKHVKNCTGIRLMKEGTWWTNWGPIPWQHGDAPIVNTWRRYGKRGRKLLTWVRFFCNDTRCKAELHVEASFILRAASTNTSKIRHEIS